MSKFAIASCLLLCVLVTSASDIVSTLPEVVIHGMQIGAVRSFSKQDIEKSGARNAAEFLQLLSGLSIRKDGASGGKQFARMGGSNVNQVLVLLDGIRLADIGSGEADLSRIPTDWIESIEVSAGGRSAHGGEAIGGVISIRTSSEVSSGFSVAARGSETGTEVGVRQVWSRGNTNASFGIIREQGMGNYRFRVTEDDGNGPFTIHLGETYRRENNSLQRDQIVGRVSHDLGRHHVFGSAWQDRSEFGLPGYLAPRPTPLARQEEQFKHAQLGWKLDSEIGLLSATTGIQSQTRDFYDPDPYSYLHESHEASERVTAAASWQCSIRETRINVSARTERDELESGVLEDTRAVRNRWQTSLQADRSFKLDSTNRQGVNVLIGTSVERFGDAKLQALPSTEISYSNQIRIPFSIGIRGSQAYLAPSFYSLFWNDELLAQGNPDLRPESSEMWQGFLKTRTRSRFTTTLECVASQNKVVDLIYWRQAFDGRWTPQNLRSASLKQLTIAVEQVVLPSHLDATFSIGWLEARDRSGVRVTDGKYLIYRPLRTVNAALNGSAFGFRGLVKLNWVDKQAVLETNSKWLAEYTLIDIELSRKFDLGLTNCDVGLRCDNILDEDYRIVRFAPMPLREFSLYLNVQLGEDND